MIKLNAREIPAVELRAELPEWLGPGGPCYIEFKARAAGTVNPEYIAAIDKLANEAQVAERRVNRINDDAKWVQENRSAAESLSRAKFAALYDTCVIDWSTNIQDGGKNLKPSRETFLELINVRCKAIADVLLALEERCVAAGEDGEAVIEDSAKN